MCLPTIRNIYMYKRVLKTGKANVVRKPVGILVAAMGL